MKFNRLQEIEQFINQSNFVAMEDLTKHFNISTQTLRRDLKELETKGVITKIYGGVVSNLHQISTFERPEVAIRSTLLIEEKVYIGKLAASEVEDGDTIYIDSGSTAFHMVAHLIDRLDITIVTHSLDVLNAVAKIPKLRCFCLGGVYQHKTNSFYSETSQIHFFFNKAFIATVGLSIPVGLTNVNYYEGLIKQTIINNSTKSYIIADHTKFGVTSFNNYANFNKISGIITNKEPPEAYCTFFKKLNINLYY